MPPPETDPEEVLWAAALAVLRRRATVVDAEIRYGDRGYPQFIGTPTRADEAFEVLESLELRVLLADPFELGNARQLRLAVATLLAERLGMRLVERLGMRSVAVTERAGAPRPPNRAEAMEMLASIWAQDGPVATRAVPEARPPERTEPVPAPATTIAPVPASGTVDPDADGTAARFRMLELD